MADDKAKADRISDTLLSNDPDRDIADPLEAAKAVSDTGKPITPDTESAKHIDRPAKKGKAGKAS